MDSDQEAITTSVSRKDIELDKIKGIFCIKVKHH